MPVPVRVCLCPCVPLPQGVPVPVPVLGVRAVCYCPLQTGRHHRSSSCIGLVTDASPPPRSVALRRLAQAGCACARKRVGWWCGCGLVCGIQVGVPRGSSFHCSGDLSGQGTCAFSSSLSRCSALQNGEMVEVSNVARGKATGVARRAGKTDEASGETARESMSERVPSVMNQ